MGGTKNHETGNANGAMMFEKPVEGIVKVVEGTHGDG